MTLEGKLPWWWEQQREGYESGNAPDPSSFKWTNVLAHMLSVTLEAVTC